MDGKRTGREEPAVETDEAVGGAGASRSRVQARYGEIGKALAKRHHAAGAGQPTVNDVATAAVEEKAGGAPLDRGVRTKVESHLGAGLTGVRVHTDALAQQSSAAMGARAFTFGKDVFLGAGENSTDPALMAHELTHVVQQGAADQEAVQRQVEVGAANSPAEVQADQVAAQVTSGAPPARLIVDGSGPLEPGQMTRDAFLRELWERVTQTADAALGPMWSAVGCPYIDSWFQRHAGTDAASLERLAQRYSGVRQPQDARDYVAPICSRVREGIQRWREGGDVSSDLAAAGLGDAAAAAAANERRDPDSAAEAPSAGAAAQRKPDDSAPLTPASLIAELGTGEPLDGSTSSRMSDAFGGEDFSNVRVHTGVEAARKVAELDASAVAVGEHVAFGGGEYAPATPRGDAMLAHELAHTVQQRGSDPGAMHQPLGDQSAAHESDADRAAGGVMARLWGGAKRTVSGAADRVGPALRSGYQLQRCDPSKSEQVEHTPTVPEPDVVPTQPVTEQSNAPAEASLLTTALPIAAGGRTYQLSLHRRGDLMALQVQLLGTREHFELPLSEIPATGLSVDSLKIEARKSSIILAGGAGKKLRKFWVQVEPSPYEAAEDARRPDRVRVYNGATTVEKDVFPAAAPTALSPTNADLSTVVSLPASGKAKGRTNMVIEVSPRAGAAGAAVTLSLQKSGERKIINLDQPNLAGGYARLTKSAAAGTDARGNAVHRVELALHGGDGATSTVGIDLTSWADAGARDEGYTWSLTGPDGPQSGGFTMPSAGGAGDFLVRTLSQTSTRREVVTGDQAYGCQFVFPEAKGLNVVLGRKSADAPHVTLTLHSSTAGEQHSMTIPYDRETFQPRIAQQVEAPRGNAFLTFDGTGRDLMISWDVHHTKGDMPKVTDRMGHIVVGPVSATRMELLVAGAGIPAWRAQWNDPPLDDDVVAPPKWEMKQIGPRVGWFRKSDRMFIPNEIFYPQVQGAELSKALFQETAIAYVHVLPVAGQLVMIGEAIVGKEIISGRTLSTTERVLYGALGAAGLALEAWAVVAARSAAMAEQSKALSTAAGVSEEQAESLIRAAGRLSKEEQTYLRTARESVRGGKTLTAEEMKRATVILDHLEANATSIRASIRAGTGAAKVPGAPLASDAIVIDANTAIALNKRALGLPLQPNELALVKHIDSLGASELRVADVAAGEIKTGSVQWRGLDLDVARKSTEYKKLVTVLDRYGVGRAKGVADRAIIADTFFAQTEPGAVARFATQDKGIYNPLLRITGKDPAKLGKPVAEAFASGFEVTINGRTIKVIPLPTK